VLYSWTLSKREDPLDNLHKYEEFFAAMLSLGYEGVAGILGLE